MKVDALRLDEAASGTAGAQAALVAIRAGADPGLSWLRFIEVGVKHGRNSAAWHAFVTTLARAAA